MQRRRSNADDARFACSQIPLGTGAADRHFFEGFHDPEAEKLRGALIRLNMFQETWIPIIKRGTYARFELFDMVQDSGQRSDIAKRHPELVAKLKQRLLAIRARVMADALDWSKTPHVPRP